MSNSAVAVLENHYGRDVLTLDTAYPPQAYKAAMHLRRNHANPDIPLPSKVWIALADSIAPAAVDANALLDALRLSHFEPIGFLGKNIETIRAMVHLSRSVGLPLRLDAPSSRPDALPPVDPPTPLPSGFGAPSARPISVAPVTPATAVSSPAAGEAQAPSLQDSPASPPAASMPLPSGSIGAPQQSVSAVSAVSAASVSPATVVSPPVVWEDQPPSMQEGTAASPATASMPTPPAEPSPSTASSVLATPARFVPNQTPSSVPSVPGSSPQSMATPPSATTVRTTPSPEAWTLEERVASSDRCLVERAVSEMAQDQPILAPTTPSAPSLPSANAYWIPEEPIEEILPGQPSGFSRRLESRVRTGQVVACAQHDLVLMDTIGLGSEVVCAGSVHAYGPLLGRVMAGTEGDTSARIYASCFRAEMVSIAGHYRVFETLPPDLEGQPVEIWLDDRHNLRFALMGAPPQKQPATPSASASASRWLRSRSS